MSFVWEPISSPRELNSTLQGVECQSSSGAQHRCGFTNELEGEITLSLHALVQLPPPRQRASVQGIRQHPRQRLCEYGDWAILDRPAKSLGTPESRGPSRRRS